MRISLGDVSLWFDVSGPSVIPLGDTTVERPVHVITRSSAAPACGPGLAVRTRRASARKLAIGISVGL